MQAMPNLLTGRSQGGKALRRSKSAADPGNFLVGPDDTGMALCHRPQVKHVGPHDAGIAPCHRPQAKHVLPPLKISGGPHKELKFSPSGSPCGEDAPVRTRSEPDKLAFPDSPGAEGAAPQRSQRSSRQRRTLKMVQILEDPENSQRGSESSSLPARRRSRRTLAWDSESSAGKPQLESPLRRSADGRCPSAPRAPRRLSSRSSSCSGGSGSGSGSQPSPATTPASPERRAGAGVAAGELLREAAVSRQEATAKPAVRRAGAISSGWVWGRQLGSGSFGSVHRAFDHASGRIFAVKKATVDADERVNKALEEELRICQDLQHPNIVGYLGHQRVDNTIQIFLEFCAGGSMAAMVAEFGPLEHMTMLPRATLGMLKGLAYMHEHKPCVVHRDVKGANLLVDTHFNVKLADFGCSKIALMSRSFTTVGSVPWMAPEVIKQDGTGYGRKADIWSAGCTVIEMATADKPWGSSAFDNLMAAMMRIGLSDTTPPIPETAPPVLRDFISACVRRDPDSRPQAAELLDHELLHE